MSSLEHNIAGIRNVVAQMNHLADKLPALRRALAASDEAILDVGQSAARFAGVPNSQEQVEAALIDATSGEFDRARLRLLKALQ